MNYESATQVQPPAGSFTLKVSDWASDYADRPLASVKLGLRLLSDTDLTYAITVAKEWNQHEAGNEKRNLITATVARAICHPEDATRQHEAFETPDDTLRSALRAETIQAIWDELERLMVTTSAIREPATDEEITALMSSIADGALDDLESLDPSRSVRVRRYLKFALDDLDESVETDDAS